MIAALCRSLLALLVAAACGLPAVHAAEYRHPSGLSFRYPSSWSLREGEGFLLLQPAGADRANPREFVVVGAEGLAGIQTLNDPRLLAWFDASLGRLVGPVERVGAPAVAGRSAHLDYRSPGGRAHRIHYLFRDGLGIYFAHVGRSAAHASAVGAMFASVGGQLAVDQRLVGLWLRSSTESTGVSPGNSSYVSASATYRFQFDARNRVAFASSSRVDAQGGGPGGQLSGSTAGRHPVRKGTYAATGTRLTILWDDGDVAEWNYDLFRGSDGPGLRLVDPTTNERFFYDKRG